MPKLPADLHRDRRESDRFRSWVRAGNQEPYDLQPDVEPPFPNPNLTRVLDLPENTQEEIVAKREAVHIWFKQFCTWKRWQLKRTDLREPAKAPECARQLDQVREYFRTGEMDKILEGA